MTLAKRSEHFPPTFGMRIVRVLNFHPTVLRINAVLPLVHYSLKTPLADFFKQQLAVAFNVLSIDDFKTLASFDQSPKLFLSFDQRNMTKIVAVEPNQIESEKYSPTSPLQEPASRVESKGEHFYFIAVRESAANCN